MSFRMTVGAVVRATVFMRIHIAIGLLCALGVSCARSAPPADEAGLDAAVKAYQTAFDTNKPAEVMAFIADDALMMEAGIVQTRAEYEKEHLPADMDFGKGVTAKRAPDRRVVRGDTAWVTTQTQFTGTYQDKPVSFQGLELMVWSRELAGWRIRAIHWSSRRN